ncbi:MAG TPA: hypothetical protein VFN67_37885 [Polyangiales bacterium]|nr:hypothetical protein [Polyangiales bacterium]
MSILQGDGLAWMRTCPAEPGTSVITSLPDMSELPELSADAWRAWFIDAARAVLAWVPASDMAIFYQSDVLHERAWISKSHYVMQAAEAEAAQLVWHKIVCRRPPGTSTWGRASYSHMLCFTRGEVPAVAAASPHVLADAGETSWARGMGNAASELACTYLRKHTGTRCIVDPFCGRGGVLAVAHTLGFEVTGVELSKKRCRAARSRLAAVSGQ